MFPPKIKYLALGAVYVEGGRFKNQKDPRRQKNSLLGLHAEILVCVVTISREEIKSGTRQSQTGNWTLLPSLLAFQQ